MYTPGPQPTGNQHLHCVFQSKDNKLHLRGQHTDWQRTTQQCCCTQQQPKTRQSRCQQGRCVSCCTSNVLPHRQEQLSQPSKGALGDSRTPRRHQPPSTSNDTNNHQPIVCASGGVCCSSMRELKYCSPHYMHEAHATNRHTQTHARNDYNRRQSRWTTWARRSIHKQQPP